MGRLARADHDYLETHFLPKKRALNAPATPTSQTNTKKKKKKTKKHKSKPQVPALFDSQHPLPESLSVACDGDSTPVVPQLTDHSPETIHSKIMARLANRPQLQSNSNDLYYYRTGAKQELPPDPTSCLPSPLPSPLLPSSMPSDTPSALCTPPSNYIPPTQPQTPTTQPLTFSDDVQESPELAPHPLPYPNVTTPAPNRDFDIDYEAVLTAVGDVNRLSRVLFRDSRRVVLTPQQEQLASDRQDVINMLVELKEMLDRMFNRFPQFIPC